MTYKWCAVPACTNTSVKTPDKLFVSVPKKLRLRKKWLQLACRNPSEIVPNSNVFFCEDHFDMHKDMANYCQYRMGFSQRIIMVEGAVPSKFDCQQEYRKKMYDINTPRPFYIKLEETQHIQDCEENQATEEQEVLTSDVNMATESQQTQNEITSTIPLECCTSISEIPEGKVVIARVFRYLQQEYEDLKTLNQNGGDLGLLANILKRTAAATGVSEDIVTAILEEEKTSEECCESTPAKRFRLDNEIRSHEEESSNAVQEGQDERGEDSQDAYELKLEVDVEDDDESYRRLTQRITQRTLTSPPLQTTPQSSTPEPVYTTSVADVRVEPVDTGHPEHSEHPQRSLTSESMRCDVTVKTEPVEDDNHYRNTAVEREVKMSMTPSTSKHRSSIGFDDEHFDQTIDDWIKLTDDLSDCDMGLSDEVCPYAQTKIPRNASTEPATHSALNYHDTIVLEAEDRQNDLATREFVPQDCYDFTWTEDRNIFTGQRETFTETPGPIIPVTDQTRITDIFYKMIDNDFVDRICTETNRYADQKIKLLRDQDKFLPTSRLFRWTPTDRNEMVSFLALTVLQGLYPLPEEESYFSFNGFGTMPYFRKIMSYNRYQLLKSMMHFVDNNNIKEVTKLSKIQPILDYFNDKFSTLYYPSQDIVIDESLLKWHGRLGFAQKIASKASQVGVKIYELCESSSGYLWKFSVYAGKDGTKTVTTTNDDTDNLEGRPEEPEMTDQTTTDRPTNATSKIVYNLVEPLLHRGHTLIMDNFYNSPLLARCLKRQKTDCYGTLRLNREFVPDSLKALTKTDLRQGEVVCSYSSDLSICVWRDANIVSLISTYHYLQIGTRQKYNRLTFKPSVVLDYNKSMGGVDRKDQYLSSHPLERVKNKIWYKKLFRRIFNTAVVNSFIIFKSGNQNISHRQFRTTLAQDLLNIHCLIDLTTEPRLITARTGLTTTTRQRQPPTAASRRPQLQDRHFPVRNGFKQSRCWLCAQRKVTARTIWKCLECNTNLCIEGCFMEYHI